LRQLATTGVPFRPGARELLADLRRAGVKTGLVTMSMRRMALSVVDLIDFPAFDVVVAGDDVERPKPFPDPYLQAAAALGVDIADTVAIEDSPNGLRSAIASGAVSLGIPLMVSLDEVGAHALWPTLEGRTADDLAVLHAAHAAAPTRLETR
ncbi:MAG: HAD family hydrolase, partial [Actinobacteria bacterium]|nr:HAD family hydrolase [Actinomycetota bacterium]